MPTLRQTRLAAELVNGKHKTTRDAAITAGYTPDSAYKAETRLTPVLSKLVGLGSKLAPELLDGVLVQTIAKRSSADTDKLRAVDIGNKVLGRYVLKVEHTGQVDHAVLVGMADRLNQNLYGGQLETGAEPAPDSASPAPEPE